MRAAQQTQAKTTLQHILVRTRDKRVRLTQTTNKRVNMEQQLDALCMSELNQFLSEDVSFPVVVVVFVGVGMLMFLLPPVPGVPVYISGGVILVNAAWLA